MNKLPAFVAIDLETTGLDFEKDEIIEVALVRFENGAPVESVDYLVKPKVAELRPFIENLTGISKADLETAEEFSAVAGKICSFIGDMPIVAHNASFDSKFLRQTLAKVGIPFEDHPIWDSLTLSRIAYQDVPNHRLDTLTQVLHIERSRAHRALPDADACGRLFVMSYEKICGMDPWLQQAFARVAQGTFWEALFGSPSTEPMGAPNYAMPLVSTVDVPATSKAIRVSEFFKEGGLLSKQIENFQVRQNQQDFASCVERNIHKGGICVLEAPTGSGKTLAYLVAAAAKAASGERVVISTATRALQEQLWTQDIPKIAPLFDGRLVPAILKGRDNYLDLNKLEMVLASPSTQLLPEEKDSFMALLPWAVSTKTGDINECSSFSHGRNRVLWSKVSSANSSGHEETGSNAKCGPYLVAKRRAASSNLLLVNHSLFLADLSLDFAILPTYEHIIFDEAHRLPEASNQAFGRNVSFFGFRNVVKTLVPSKNSRDGLLVDIQNHLPVESDELRGAVDQFIDAISEAEKALHRFFMKIGKKVAKQKASKGGFVYVNGIMAEYDADPKNMMDQYANVKTCADSLVASLRNVPAVSSLVDALEGRMNEMARFMVDFEFLVKAGREDWVFYMEEPFNPHTLKMHAYPLHSGETWSEKFYPWIKSATFTSATLAVQGDLDYFIQRMGMGKVPASKHPFLRVYNETFDKNARQSVMLAKYLPKPSAPEFNDAMVDTLVQVLPEVKENTMVLFTSVSAMMKAQAALAPVFAEKKKILLCQHVDGSLDGLVAMFRNERGACLLGCQTLWEGVDFPGDALKLLVIPKLPFPNPMDPVVAGISNDLKNAGKNSFKDYFIPEAYMEMRQGLGRLLRSEEDSGKVLILDNRIVTEHYGKSFMKIWNFKQKIANSVDEIKSFV